MSNHSNALPPAPPGKETIFSYLLNAFLFVCAFYAQKRLAFSYRNFRVGAACIARRSNKPWWTGRRYRLFIAGNTQAKPGWHPEKSCSEKKLMKKAEKAGFDKILVIAIVAPGQSDDHSGVYWGALIPCGHCRLEFSSHVDNGGPVKRDTRIIAFNLETWRCVRITVADLAGLRNEFRAD